ncbi:uncharacterized protein N7511_002686 [Penicillium nucicola]|uniref:uncharacterized protein n=1 Tax=Penicillium nucicola TaxID=1850975 RepID=UPI0025459012|nr:uncharacterized protein N7511_002686 [Penicillium nucicola]KAJ5770635.1 hypothetical protein N7511_002686 [Penicillium nucicola]
MESQTFPSLSGNLDWTPWKNGLRDELSTIDRYAWDVIEGIAICPDARNRVPSMEVATTKLTTNNNDPVNASTEDQIIENTNSLTTDLAPQQADDAITLEIWNRANNLGLKAIRASTSTIPFGIILGITSSRQAFLQLENLYGKPQPNFDIVRAMYHDWSQMRFSDNEDPAVFVHCFCQALSIIRSQPCFVHSSSEWLVFNTAVKDTRFGWEFLDTNRFINHGAEGWMDRVYQEFIEYVATRQYPPENEESDEIWSDEVESDENFLGSTAPTLVDDDSTTTDSSLEDL